MPCLAGKYDAGTGYFQILLGRDVICGGVLTSSFDGHYSLSL
jgi:hypothetical protein